MNISFNVKLLAISFFIVTCLGLTGYAIYKSNQKLLNSAEWVQHTHQVIYESDHVLSLVKDIETSSRGFIISNDSTFLEPLWTAEKTIFTSIAQLRQLTRDNPAQQQRVDSLGFYTLKRLDFSFQTVEVRSKQGLLAACAFVSIKQGKQYTDRIRQITEDIQQEENILLNQRQQANESSMKVFNRISVAMFVLMAVFIILLSFVTINYTRQQQKHVQETKQWNAQLKHKMGEIKELYDKAPCGYFSVNAGIVISNINNTLLQWLGYTALEVVGKMKYEDLLSPDSRALHLSTFNEVFADFVRNGYANDLEYEFKRKDGTNFPALVNSIAVLDENGNFVTSRSSVFDNTERIKNQEQLLASNKELESFSYSVSHDLRSPLRAIHGYTKILSEEYGARLDEEASRLMKNIMTNAKKMGQLIDDLLTFSHLGRKELVKRESSMNDIVTIVCSELRNQQAQSAATEFRIKELLPAHADCVTMKQVWANLISNALKFSKLKEKAIIEIGSEIKGEDILYYIKDNGAGFDMKYANKLFGVFHRLHSEMEFEGTGVGLAIVQRIISRHGGRVWAESKVNEGATFYFSVPKNIIL